MQTETAIIDIGSNSVRYGIYAMTGGRVTSRAHALFTTRLGADLPATGRLPAAAMERTLAVMAGLAAAASRENVPAFAYATSAMRDAADGMDFACRITADTGIPVRILTGEEEAEFALAGATGGSGGLIDIGGASAQLCAEGFAMSFPAGCVRMKTALPEWDDGALRRLLAPLFRFPRIRLPWFAAGGTATTLAALKLGLPDYDREPVHGSVLTREGVAAAVASLSAMTDAERAALPLLRDRHDVILYGASILAFIMDGLSAPSVTVTVTDAMEGYFLRLRDGR